MNPGIRQDRGTTSLSKMLAALVLLATLGVSSAFGQSTYSDEWLDDSNPDAASIVGSGVTEGEYTHRYYVSITMNSPAGRSRYLDSAENVGYVRGDTGMSWDWNDVGDYTTSTEHWELCPYGDVAWVWAGYSFGSGKVGYSKICYQWDHYDSSKLNPNVYKIVAGCGDRISCWNTYFYSFYHAGMRAKSAQG